MIKFQKWFRIGSAVIVMAVFLLPFTIYAQTYRDCPFPEPAMYPRFVEVPGTYPSNTSFCSDVLGDIRVGYGSDPLWACGAAMIVNVWDPQQAGQANIFAMPPNNLPFPNNRAQIRMQVMLDSSLDYDVHIRFDAYDSSNNPLGSTTVRMMDYPYDLNLLARKIYKLDFEIPFDDGGWVAWYVTSPAGPYDSYGVRYSGFKIKDYWYSMPGFCPVNTITPTPTPSPTPTTTASPTPTLTPTPTETGTPSYTPDPSVTASTTPEPSNTPLPTSTPEPSETPTPSQTYPPFPTSAGGTGTPIPTSTSIYVSTIRPGNTPTRLSVPGFPTVVVTGVGFPVPDVVGTPVPFDFDLDITPNVTSQAQATQIAEWAGGNLAVVTRWYTTTVFSTGSFSTTITGTAGYSSVVEIAGVLGESVAAPLSYARLIQTYLPNLWPLVLFLILAVGWIFFNLVAKYAISIIGNLGELIRRLIELLPGF